MRSHPIIFDMAGRPSLGLKRKGFAIYEKTWLILKDLENKSAHTERKKKMVELVHEAVEQYANSSTVSKEEKNGRVRK